MDLWRNSFNLSEVVMETLDEESVLKFIQLALGSKGIDNTFAFQVCY